MDSLQRYRTARKSPAKDQEEKEETGKEREGAHQKEDWGRWSKDAFSKVGQLTSNYSKGVYQNSSILSHNAVTKTLSPQFCMRPFQRHLL